MRSLRLAAWVPLLLALACGLEPAGPRNLVLVSFDTLRADRLGSYGRKSAGTPTLDALARGGVRFADAMAPAPITLPSHATLFTGRDPLRHGVRHNALFSLTEDAVTLAERMSEAGLRSGAFVGSIVLAEHHGLAQGFERYTAPESGSAAGLFFLGERSALEVNRDALAWIDEIGDDRFFLFVHYMEAHAPYEPPEPLRSQHEGDAYQGEVATVDRAFGQLLGALKERERLRETLLVAMADHGESLREHGEVTHGIFVYQATLHVPLLAVGPGVLPARVVNEPVGLVDVAPTVLDAFGLAPLHDVDGRSLWPVMTGTGPAPQRDLYAESFVPRYDFGWSELRALRSGRHKVISAPRPELYALDADPGETHDLAREEPQRLSVLSETLARRVEAVELEAKRAEPVEIGSEERSALEALGYLSGAHAGGAPAGSLDPKDHVNEAVKMERAGRLIRRDKRTEARRLLRSLLDTNPAFVEARLRLIVALVLDGEIEAAEEESRRLAELARQLPDGARVAARGHVLVAHAHLDRDRLAAAARELERALPLNSVHAMTLLAAVYHDLGRREEAVALLQRLHAEGRGDRSSRETLRYLEGRGPAPERPDPGT